MLSEQMRDIIKYFEDNNISFQENIDLKTKTWIKRGGITKLWIQPEKLSDFEKIIVFLQQQNIDFEVIGNASNCYFLNTYHPNIVISTLKLQKIQVFDKEIICDCGYQMSKLARLCNIEGFAGYEGFVGLPGTISGAVVNNSGCYGSLISEVVKEIKIILQGKINTLTNAELKYSNRTSILKTKEVQGVILSVTFDIIRKENPDLLQRKSEKYQKHRKTFQEHIYPNLGTTFCKLDFKYSFLQFFIKKSFNLIVKIFVKDDLKRQYNSLKIFLLVFETRKFRKYVSKHGIQCFTWKDEGADEAFLKYVEFIEKNTTKAIMEIEIKG